MGQYQANIHAMGEGVTREIFEERIVKKVSDLIKTINTLIQESQWNLSKRNKENQSNCQKSIKKRESSKQPEEKSKLYTQNEDKI